MKGAEAEMKRKEVKGNARNLSDMRGRHAKEAKFKSRKLTGIQGKGNKRIGRARCPVAGCVASACKSGLAVQFCLQGRTPRLCLPTDCRCRRPLASSAFRCIITARAAIGARVGERLHTLQICSNSAALPASPRLAEALVFTHRLHPLHRLQLGPFFPKPFLMARALASERACVRAGGRAMRAGAPCVRACVRACVRRACVREARARA